MRLDSKRKGKKMGKTDLQVKFGSQKSFYGKAQVLENGMGDKMLFSYDVLVAGVIEGEARVYNLKSATTLRHVKEFLLQNGFKAENKAQIKEDYLVN